MLVPLMVPYPPPGTVESTLTPGAQSSISGPALLKAIITLLLSIAETAMTVAYLAGNPTLVGSPVGVWPECPAAATINSPLLQACCTSFPTQ